jgi:hypothetical protein
MTEDEVTAVLDVLSGGGSMTAEQIASELADREGYSIREAKLAVATAVQEEAIEEHPSFDECYRPVE